MVDKLLFVDANIWLDFYRGGNDFSIQLLDHLEAIQDKLIITYQLETEFKKNRQRVILDSIKSLKQPDFYPRPAFFSDAKIVKTLNSNIKNARSQTEKIKQRLEKALENPAINDPVYKACQRIFRSRGVLVLSRDDSQRNLRTQIRRKALRRFLHGCPPRKNDDTSIGDAINWEWMIECALKQKAELVIVSRDADYGIDIGKKAYVNDHLQQEFKERVSQKRKVQLYTKLTAALDKEFKLSVSKSEKEEEDKLISAKRELNEYMTINYEALIKSINDLDSSVKKARPLLTEPSVFD